MQAQAQSKINLCKIQSQAENQPSPVDKSIESPSCSTAFSPPTRLTSEKPLLERLKMHYKTMSLIRLNSELHARNDPPHPLKISLDGGPFYPTTYGALNIGLRILLSAALDFGCAAFPEFESLHDEEKWTIVVNFFYRFRIFEGGHRSNKLFPDDRDKCADCFPICPFAIMTKCGIQDMSLCLSTSYPFRYLRDGDFRSLVIPTRDRLAQMNPCHEEFLVVVALMFWSSEEQPMREEITHIGERYRQEILKELHAFYREERGLDDYAARIGE
ncbi:hypothetical protein PFISCL1PPCAC_13133, partial [Pristionchus fissidentatus]